LSDNNQLALELGLAFVESFKKNFANSKNSFLIKALADAEAQDTVINKNIAILIRQELDSRNQRVLKSFFEYNPGSTV